MFLQLASLLISLDSKAHKWMTETFINRIFKYNFLLASYTDVWLKYKVSHPAYFG